MRTQPSHQPNLLQPLLPLFHSLPDAWRLCYDGFQLFAFGPLLGDRRRNLLRRLTPAQQVVLDRLWDDLQGPEYTPGKFDLVELLAVEIQRDGKVYLRWSVAATADYPPRQEAAGTSSVLARPTPVDTASHFLERCPSRHQGG